MTIAQALTDMANNGVNVVFKGLNFGHHSVADAAYQILANDYYVAATSISAARTFTLPAVAGLADGQVLIVADESGSVTATLGITVAGSGSETIDGAANVKIQRAYGYVILMVNAARTGWKQLAGKTYALRTAVNDAAYTILKTDTYVGYTALSSARIATLPTLASCEDGQLFSLADEAGAAATYNLTLKGNGSENIDEANTKVLSSNYGSVTVRKAGTIWKIVV